MGQIRSLVLGGVTVLLLLLTGPSSAVDNATLIFDFGKLGSVNSEKYHFVSPSDGYAREIGYGWLHKEGYPFDRPGKYYMEELVRDGVTFKDNTFRADLPYGEHTITVLIGDMDPKEIRVNGMIMANGRMVARGQRTEGRVKAITFGVRVTAGILLLRFLAEDPAMQIAVCGVIIREGKGPKEAIIQDSSQLNMAIVIPDKWAVIEERLASVIRGIGRDDQGFGDYWIKERLPKHVADVNKRKILLWDEYLLSENQSRLLPLVRKMGMDGICVRAQSNLSGIEKWTAEQGLIHTVIYTAELHPERKFAESQSNLLQAPTGESTMIPGVYSSLNPDVQESFRKYVGANAEVLAGVKAVIFDEPRGCWRDGFKMGDFSPGAEVALKKWAKANNYPSIAAKGFPTIAWSHDAYGFYLFRLNAISIFMNAVKESPVLAGKDIYPGNATYLTQTNHLCVWPPFYTKSGINGAQWLYFDPPFRVKYAMEMMKATGNGTDYWAAAVPGYGPKHWDVNPLPMSTLRLVSGLTSLPDQLTIWGMTTLFADPVRMASFIDTSRLVRATSNFERRTGIYLYMPDSLIYPDFINWNQEEGSHAEAVISKLFNANLDFRVSYDLATTPGLVLYFLRKSVLTFGEWMRIEHFLAKGGIFVYASMNPPVNVDNQPLKPAASIFERMRASQVQTWHWGNGVLHWRPDGVQVEFVRSLAEFSGIPVNQFWRINRS